MSSDAIIQWITSLFEPVTQIAGLIIGCVIIFKCAVFYIKAQETKRKLEVERFNSEKLQDELTQLNSEIQAYRLTTIRRSLIFLKSDDHPRYPLCPVCYSDGKIIRMGTFSIPHAYRPNVEYGHTAVDGQKPLGLGCIRCKNSLTFTDIDVLEQLSRSVDEIPESPSVAFDSCR